MRVQTTFRQKAKVVYHHCDFVISLWLIMSVVGESTKHLQIKVQGHVMSQS